jgi:hypothetical protein
MPCARYVRNTGRSNSAVARTCSVEPAPCLAVVLDDEFAGIVVLEPLLVVLEREMHLRECHRARLEPAVEHFPGRAASSTCHLDHSGSPASGYRCSARCRSLGFVPKSRSSSTGDPYTSTRVYLGSSGVDNPELVLPEGHGEDQAAAEAGPVGGPRNTRERRGDLRRAAFFGKLG